jgi:hypothetical protein
MSGEWNVVVPQPKGLLGSGASPLPQEAAEEQEAAAAEEQESQVSQVSEGKAAGATEEQVATAAAAEEQVAAATEEEVAAASEEKAAAAASVEATEEEAAAASEERAAAAAKVKATDEEAAAAGKPAAVQEPAAAKNPAGPEIYDLALRGRADLNASQLDVDILNKMLMDPDAGQHVHVPGIPVGEDLTRNLTWLVIGCNPRSIKWQEVQNIKFHLPVRALVPRVWALRCF